MRRRQGRLLAGAMAALAVPVLIAGSVAVGAAADSSITGFDQNNDSGQLVESESESNRLAGHATGTVTLLTGDKVRLEPRQGGRPVLSVEPGPGRDGIGYVDHVNEDGRLSVVPADALAPLGEGRLDPRLFDVTGLLEAEYDDANAAELPLIVTYDDSPSSARQALAVDGTRISRELPSIDGAAVRTDKADATAFWSELTVPADSSGIEKVWLDGQVHASLDQSVPQVGAPKAWEAGYTGKGVRTAVLDTGIDATHPDLADAVLKAKDFTDSPSGTKDLFGHGTHVASIVTGNAQASDGKYKGVAPDAELLNGKVLDDSGSGWDSGIIAGMEWAVDQGAKVVNLSLGGCATDGTDPLSRAVNRLTNQSGTLFVIAAGNHPNNPYCAYDERVSAPASANQALAVASVTKSDQLSDFSNLGPRVEDSALKPEISAPGESIVAARAKGTTLGPPVNAKYVKASGTSMAAPHVAGAAAVLAQQHPKWDADELRSALLATAKRLPSLSVFEQGAGRLDVGKAIGQRVLTTPASLSLGRQAWPHADDEPVDRTVTYRNPTSSPLTLDLHVAGIGPNGEAAPADLFTVSRDEITVPAKGSARVRVTADTTIQSTDGLYSGWLTAHDGSRLVSSTPIGLDKEVESYDLTLRVIGRNGKPMPTQIWLTEVRTGQLRSFDVPKAGTTLRLPKQRYDLSTAVFGQEGERNTITMVAAPDVLLGKDRTVRLDARRGLPVDVELDSETAEPQGEVRVWLDNGSLNSGIIGGNDPNSAADLYATPTREVTSYPYEFGYLGGYAEPISDTSKGKRPRGYNLYLTEEGQIPDHPTFRVADSELARHDTTVHGQGVRDTWTGTLASAVYSPGSPLLYEIAYDVRGPSRRTDFYSAPPGIRWDNTLTTPRLTEYGVTGWNPVRYEPGKRYDQHWNGGPIGTVLRSPFAYDMLWSDLSVFAPSYAPHKVSLGQTNGTNVKFSLRKNGELVHSTTDPNGGEPVELPAEEATYEWRLKATRDVEWSTLGTEVNARWKVTGGPDRQGQLPIPGLWINGDVDLLSRVSADEPFPVSLRVEDYASVPTDVESITLDVSFDDGASWQSVPVNADGDGFAAVVPKPPKGSEFGSFRASVRGVDGSLVEQTVIRAYALK